MFTSGLKVVSGFWNQFQTNDSVTSKVGQGRPRASISAQDYYLAFSARRHRQTKTHQLSRELTAVFRRRISWQKLYNRLTKTGH
ncbi:hypothetical protein TNCV_3133401 [Trichonephila clavipes]|nr:hypothetical protein TNCV_3133401 [Trichonephila clavipes]